MTTREETKRRALVEMHYAEGGEVECILKPDAGAGDAGGSGIWSHMGNPSWDWKYCDYRPVQPNPKTKMVEVYQWWHSTGALTLHITNDHAKAHGYFGTLHRIDSTRMVIEVPDE